MDSPVSIRFRRAEVAARLRAEAVRQQRSTSALAEELLDEAMRARRHPLIGFRGGPAGRRAALVGGPDVWEMIDAIAGGDVAPNERIARAVDTFGWTVGQVEAALAYYAEFTEEIDALRAANVAAADEAEASWRRSRGLLAQ